MDTVLSEAASEPSVIILLELGCGELVNASVDGEIVLIEGRREVGADAGTLASGPTLPASIAHTRSVPSPRMRLSSATSRSALRSAFICRVDAGGAVCSKTCPKARVGG